MVPPNNEMKSGSTYDTNVGREEIESDSMPAIRIRLDDLGLGLDLRDGVQ